MIEIVRHNRAMKPAMLTESIYVSWRELEPIMRDSLVIDKAIEKAKWDKWAENRDQITAEIVPTLAGYHVTLVRIVWQEGELR